MRGRKPRCTDAEFIRLFEDLGATETARRLGTRERKVHARRRAIEVRHNIVIKTPNPGSPTAMLVAHPARRQETVKDGMVMVGSDAHYWPGIVSTAHRAFVWFARELQPKLIVKNGDVTDFPSISRHAMIGWEERPKVSDEIETCKERLQEIEDACKNALLYWPLGNHDGRFETRLATQAPEYAKVHGVHLKDHFPRWRPCWSLWVNENTVIKHRFKGGVHATSNNTLWAGKTMVTGHLHALQERPISDYNGTRWGVDCGTLAEPYGPQFVNYTEDNPVNWRSGFYVLTYHKGALLWPEPVHVLGPNEVSFRGKVYLV
jgi:hypothetical protein